MASPRAVSVLIQLGRGQAVGKVSELNVQSATAKASR